ncbi:MAG: 1-acyl-sn-glycerol-3-phosphate acyltransferase [Robiginitomaculum sp.]|nr:1-acyl-sn-glycerol-3-phosphate acyltransferase [Robiginitomaculum sp.]
MNKISDHIPEQAPRIGNAFTRFIGRMLLRSIGYKVEGKFANEPKMILIAAPHTSNWDLIIALGTILSLGVRINFMMKKSAFFFPFKNLFMSLGGMPIDRANPKATVKQIIRTFEERNKFWYAILPEGTRKPVDTWKAGFIRIARKANVPIYMMGLDARTKTLHLDKLVLTVEDIKDGPTGHAIEQAEELRLYAKEKFCGINPENN